METPSKDTEHTKILGHLAGALPGVRSKLLGLLSIILPASLVAGCGGNLARLRTPERLEKGYVIILPGIEGRSVLNENIAKGLVDGGVESAIEIYDWTAGPVWLFPITLRAKSRNQHEAQKIAQKIVQYQDAHPDRPVHIIGHSGGGGEAVLTLEALPRNRRIASAILLAPAIAPDYNLTRALKRTGFGIYNYYSRYDLFFLTAGTTIMGTIDGQHARAAGAAGFNTPQDLTAEGKELYRTRLHQQRYTKKMAEHGHRGLHIGWAKREFVANWLAPVIRAQDIAAAHKTRHLSQTDQDLSGKSRQNNHFLP
jgi:alpha-beta hydrolase superfamily lysophospholipase